LAGDYWVHAFAAATLPPVLEPSLRRRRFRLMATQADLERVWDIVEKVGVGMLTTRFRGGLRSRPVEPRPDREAGVIRVVTDARGLKDDEIENSPAVGLAIVSASDKAYLSITAHAAVIRDAAIAQTIWHKSDDLWWSGPDDPNVRVIVLTPSLAELWDGPSSSAVVAFEIAKAKLTGKKPNLGENRKKTMALR
jgi:general stress protein 26